MSMNRTKRQTGRIDMVYLEVEVQYTIVFPMVCLGYRPEVQVPH